MCSVLPCAISRTEGGENLCWMDMRFPSRALEAGNNGVIQSTVAPLGEDGKKLSKTDQFLPRDEKKRKHRGIIQITNAMGRKSFIYSLFRTQFRFIYIYII